MPFRFLHSTQISLLRPKKAVSACSTMDTSTSHVSQSNPLSWLMHKPLLFLYGAHLRSWWNRRTLYVDLYNTFNEPLIEFYHSKSTSYSLLCQDHFGPSKPMIASCHIYKTLSLIHFPLVVSNSCIFNFLKSIIKDDVSLMRTSVNQNILVILSLAIKPFES